MMVSVVIATRGDRPAALERCLDGLEAGSVRPHEVIVVDQGPGGSLGTGRPFAVEVVALAGRGLSRGRNAGIRRAASDVVAVTDDDCVPGAAWLETALA